MLNASDRVNNVTLSHDIDDLHRRATDREREPGGGSKTHTTNVSYQLEWRNRDNGGNLKIENHVPITGRCERSAGRNGR